MIENAYIFTMIDIYAVPQETLLDKIFRINMRFHYLVI